MECLPWVWMADGLKVDLSLKDLCSNGTPDWMFCSGRS